MFLTNESCNFDPHKIAAALKQMDDLYWFVYWKVSLRTTTNTEQPQNLKQNTSILMRPTEQGGGGHSFYPWPICGLRRTKNGMDACSEVHARALI